MSVLGISIQNNCIMSRAVFQCDKLFQAGFLRRKQAISGCGYNHNTCQQDQFIVGFSHFTSFADDEINKNIPSVRPGQYHQPQ